ncbi:uncharacterized protein LOC112091640 [Morus notabilis]|nr:uncharacterized protein LOC112091640 [Morus notabilis]
MAMSSSAESSISLKLLMDTKGKRVLFGEAGKDFTDFLFNLLSLPVGTIVRLLSTNGMVGSIGKLYKSFENLSDTYIQPNVLNKDTLLKPNSPIGGSTALLSLTTTNQTSPAKRVYICSWPSNNYQSGSGGSLFATGYSNRSCSKQHASDDPRAICPNCKRNTSIEVPYVAPPAPKVGGSSSEGGFVKGVVTYMIMDNLEVKPMSTISSIAMLNKFNVKEVGALEEKIVSVGMKEGLKLLKASLQTNTVLTDVFLD